MSENEKRELMNRLIDLRTEHIYNSHLYQGIQLAIEVVDKYINTLPTRNDL